jgi:hypothetical protein
MTMAATAPRRIATEPPPMMADVGAAPGAVVVVPVGKPAPVLVVPVMGLLLVAVVLLLREREPLLGDAAVGVIIEAELVVMVPLRCEVLLPK